MFDNIVLVENGNKIEFSSKEEVVKFLIDKDFYNLSKEEKKEKLNIKAIANCLGLKKEITDIVPNSIDKIDNYFIIKDEITFIYSLLLTNKIYLLERYNSNIFSKDIDKSNLKDGIKENDYIVINKFAKDLLLKYLDLK